MHRFAIVFLFVCLQNSLSYGQTQPVSELRNFLSTHSLDQISNEGFANVALTSSQAKEASATLLSARVAELKKQRAQEWKDKVIAHGDHSMKFEFRVFGDKPASGRSLFISMHGGGGAPAKVNDQQWKNQIRLYEPAEGVYLAPRAPTDSWNLWHQSHIDPMFARIIENAILFEDVNPNRIYIMGYSAGGDGTYQLAPRMADQLAAAAMMAGHPNDAKPFGLRNIGFTIHMGGKDAAYKRNQIAKQWKERLAELKEEDPKGYAHQVTIHEQHGHWMQRDDAVAVDWMSKFTRDPLPSKVVWFQSGVTHNRFYWLAVDEENRKGGSHVVATREGQAFSIEKTDGVESIIIRLNDEMADLDQPIKISVGEKVVEKKVVRTIGTMARCLLERADPEMIFSAEITVDVTVE